MYIHLLYFLWSCSCTYMYLTYRLSLYVCLQHEYAFVSAHAFNFDTHIYSFYLQTLSLTVAGDNLTTRLRSYLFKAMLRQEMGWHDEERNSTEVLNSRLSLDARRVQIVCYTYIILYAQHASYARFKPL